MARLIAYVVMAALCASIAWAAAGMLAQLGSQLDKARAASTIGTLGR